MSICRALGSIDIHFHLDVYESFYFGIDFIELLIGIEFQYPFMCSELNGE